MADNLVLGTDRNGLLAARPDFAGYQSNIRLAGFCRTGTGLWRVKYKYIRQPELAENFKFILIFGLLSLSIMILIIISNKIVFTV